MELAGLVVALGEAVSGGWANAKAYDVTVDFINTVHLGCTKFIKQHEIKSSTR